MRVLAVLLLSGCGTYGYVDYNHVVQGDAARLGSNSDIPLRWCAGKKLSRCHIEACHTSSVLAGEPFGGDVPEFDQTFLAAGCQLWGER